MAATSAYDSSGAPEKIEQVNESYEQKRELSHQQAVGAVSEEVNLVGSGEGPQHPFPIQFAGKVVQGSGRSRRELGVPTANLASVSEGITLRPSGVYVAWAKIQAPKKLKENMASKELYDIWHPALVTVASPKDVHQTSVFEKRSVSAYLINDFGNDTTFFNCKLSVMIMGFMRSSNHTTFENQILQLAQDITVAQASLERPAWQAEILLERIKTESSTRSFTEKIADAREAGQKQVDKVPVHWLGVRTDSMGLKDQLIGNGGICVKR